MTKGSYPRSPEHRKHLSEANKGKRHSEQTKMKMSLAHKGKPHHWIVSWPGTKNPMYGTKRPDLSLRNKNPEFIERSRERNRALTKQWWQNPSYREKVLREVAKATHKRPNKAEQTLLSLLDKICPGKFEYSGDGKVIILGMVPDFIDSNGQKQVIELFGDYWHSPEVTQKASWKSTELGRTMAYNSIGYRCLIIWESELQDKDKLIAKIRMFRECRGKRLLL